MSFRVRNLCYRYPGATEDAVRGMTAEFPRSLHTVIVGPNGAGKSTLLRLLLGRLRPRAGEAAFEGRPSHRWPRRTMARRVAAVLQEMDPLVPFTVRQLVEMGRHPYLASWAPLRPGDRRIVDEVLRLADLEALQNRVFDTLSAGERQRARVARALAQQPRCLLLDEPTAHLDVAHEMAVFELVRHLVITYSLTVITITHNINLAGRYADRVVVLADGLVIAEGEPSLTFTAPNLERAFSWPMAVETFGDLGVVVVPLPGPFREEGS